MTSEAGASACRVCGAEKAAFRLEARGYQFFSCQGCGYVQIDPPPSALALHALYGEDYFDKGKYVVDRAERREQERRVSLLRKAGVKTPARLLDYGCATGAFLSHAKQEFDMWGAEVSAAALSKARDRLPDLSGRLLGLDELDALETGFFDGVLLWDVVEHLLHPVEDLRKAARLVRPGGVMAFSTPDIGAVTARLMGRRWAFMTPPEHVGFFDRRALFALMKDLGFEPVTSFSRGKWVNLGFLLYKISRILPELVSQETVGRVRRSAFGRLCLYVPTGDILYAVGVKQGA
ncbi:MAG: class I SAM-dependent methyltransferase [Rhodospirillales bacterium]|nr:class I SAM-dependent methyltransferase [Rhodospirillales bacterium]